MYSMYQKIEGANEVLKNKNSLKVDSKGSVSGSIDGHSWIIRIGKDKHFGCSITQTIHLQMDAEEWDILTVVESIKKTLLELEKQIQK